MTRPGWGFILRAPMRMTLAIVPLMLLISGTAEQSAAGQAAGANRPLRVNVRIGPPRNVGPMALSAGSRNSFGTVIFLRGRAPEVAYRPPRTSARMYTVLGVFACRSNLAS